MIPTEFDILADTFVELRATLSPSEIHGELSGYLCASLSASEASWLDMAQSCLQIDDELPNPVRIKLLNLFDETLDQLEEPDREYQLLLPSDDEPLALRVEALGQWCLGFLAGFAFAGGMQRLDELSVDAREAFDDIKSISGIDNGVEDEEASEKDFYQVSEYIRIALLLIYADLNKPSDEVDADTHKPQQLN